MVGESRPIQAGEPVTWLYESRGGYGYITPVPATVVKVTARRVTIDASLRNGGTRRISVKRQNIRQIGDSIS